jgi:hypothetical protein
MRTNEGIKQRVLNFATEDLTNSVYLPLRQISTIR